MQIALIHAVRLAMGPIEAAFRKLWPEPRCVNILDDSLSADRARDGCLTAEMHRRFQDLGDYARRGGADAIVFTCSAFGPAIEGVAESLDIPVLKPNEAMFAQALDAPGPVGLLASFKPSLDPMADEYRSMAAGSGATPDLRCHVAEGAMDALNTGDGAKHDALLAQAADTLADCKTIMLAQFSTARAKPAVAAATGRTVLTSPESAVLEVRRRLTAR